MERVDQLVSGFLKRRYDTPVSRILSKLRLPLLDDLEPVSCNLCGSDDAVEVGRQDKFGLPVRSVMCRNCGLMYLNPRPSSRRYDEFYVQGGDREGVYHVSLTLREMEPLLQRYFGPAFRMSGEDRRALHDYIAEKYRQHVGEPPEGHGEAMLIDALESRAKEHEAAEYDVYANDVYAHFHRFVPRGGRVLEMGAAWGKLLVPWRERHGCEVTGVEPRARTVEAARERLGITLFHGFPGSVAVPEQTYDAVLNIRTINHMVDPLGDLRHAWRWLKPDGLMIVDISDAVREARYEGFEANVVEIDHPYMFTIDSLSALLQQAGFEIVDREIVDTRRIFPRPGHAAEYKQIRIVGRKSLAPVTVSFADPLVELAELLRGSLARTASLEAQRPAETRKKAKKKQKKKKAKAKHDAPKAAGEQKTVPPTPSLLGRARWRVKSLVSAARRRA